VLAPVAFLTVVPVGRIRAFDERDLVRGALLFPLVGGALGLAAGLLADVLVPDLPGLVAGALAVGLAALVTGAMHLDALADVCDALGGRSRERALEIMRDHSVGAFGATGLAVVVLVDAAAIGALATTGDAALAGLAAGAAGRAAMLPLARALPYARPGDGQGRVLAALGWPAVAAGLLVALGLAVPAGEAGIGGLAAAVVVAWLLGLFAMRWVGGVTGDVLGATAKLGETAALVTMLATGT
jgi:cobalamin 5'-phosphate synthase/cobalamin synthase